MAFVQRLGEGEGVSPMGVWGTWASLEKIATMKLSWRHSSYVQRIERGQYWWLWWRKQGGDNK